MTIRVRAVIETVPPDHTGVDPDHQQGELAAGAETYEQARDQILAELPEGWRVVHLRTV